MSTWDGTSPDSPTTNFLLTDTLGSVVSSFNNLPNGAATVLGDQVYGPYGNRRVQQGTISTSKGFTGQFTDFVAGLDYYGARYYDPVVGVFVSADVVQGNGSGMNPYAYVAGNPETYIDPTGLSIWGDLGGLVQDAEQVATQVEQNAQQFVTTEPLPVVAATTVVAAPVATPFLLLLGISAVAATALMLLTPQNLASGTLPPASPIGFDPPRQNNGGNSSPSGFDPPRQNNVDPSQPQTQAGGGGQVPPKGPPPATTSPKPRKPLPRKPGGGFQSDQKLQKHYREHNSEFDPPFVSPEQYEARGLRFMQGDLPEGSLQGRFIAEYYEGDIIRYNTITNEFGMLTENGVLRSYYLPEEGINEFWRTMMPNGRLELP